ncbi:divalent-cation tolerance protein CutA [Chelatococcus reniformis]|uniref:Divalent-cation tolerance protein CutA n=1 Tax=Chelatococcus reniformis TaxID=1494448 RepID=A0A916UGR6_9HYPH|nr:divalent-cation tolerance protein CutA [Chelatococcus reniformis]GGC71791.1 divalent-cation tolerance protein CutA [Chelatococcus reniformis]
MDKTLLVYTTFPDERLAADAARELVRRRLAACVNVIPGMQSVYAWHGEIEEGREAVVIFKTRTGRRDELVTALRAVHPYETPVVMILEAAADDATAAWIMRETAD